jgi:hypothetical protein
VERIRRTRGIGRGCQCSTLAQCWAGVNAGAVTENSEGATAAMAGRSYGPRGRDPSAGGVPSRARAASRPTVACLRAPRRPQGACADRGRAAEHRAPIAHPLIEPLPPRTGTTVTGEGAKGATASRRAFGIDTVARPTKDRHTGLVSHRHIVTSSHRHFAAMVLPMRGASSGCFTRPHPGPRPGVLRRARRTPTLSALASAWRTKCTWQRC